MVIRSGGSALYSGPVLVASDDSGLSGVSGDLVLASGLSTAGDSGAVQLSTGTKKSAGGTISLSVGTIMGDGGDVLLTAGTSLDAASAIVEIRGGLGASAHAVDGGNGGMVRIFGGEARGASAQDAGGSLLLQGGAAFAGTGGSVRIAAGAGTATSSGSVLIETPNAGRAGVSGSITLRSGTTSQGDSGYTSCSLRATRSRARPASSSS